MLEALKKYFSYQSFKTGQKELIESILSKRDSLGIMPTGSGKSLCFQLPALLFKDLSLVITPLNSLMLDQVQALQKRAIKALYINSSLNNEQLQFVYKNLSQGLCKILYISPERLQNSFFLSFLSRLTLAQIVVDEAHCISTWGQDFRPSYLYIAKVLEHLKQRPVISAFSATATPAVKQDIIKLLNLQNPFVLTTGFNRENLFLELKESKDKLRVLLYYLQKFSQQSGIIYCATRKICEELFENLKLRGFHSCLYHAGMSNEERFLSQNAFLKGEVLLMIATNAFGMGIDKKDIRFVIHYNCPKNLESYYQEIGRAGRDGKESHCVLLYQENDMMIHKFLITNSKEKTQEVMNNELKLLWQMKFFVKNQECLKAYILNYFGEHYEQKCQKCSSCIKEVEEVDKSIEAQKILSCIKRMGENFGSKMLCDVLRAKNTQKIQKNNFHKLSTYGLMKEYSQDELDILINALIFKGYILQSQGAYPILKLSTKAKNILFHNEQFKIKIPKKSSFSKDTHQDLFEKLRALRLEFAKKERVSAFIIFSDKSLRHMCELLPQNEEELSQVYGVSQRKLEKYGKDFLSLLKAEKSKNLPASSLFNSI